MSGGCPSLSSRDAQWNALLAPRRSLYLQRSRACPGPHCSAIRLGNLQRKTAAGRRLASDSANGTKNDRVGHLHCWRTHYLQRNGYEHILHVRAGQE